MFAYLMMYSLVFTFKATKDEAILFSWGGSVH